MVSLFLLAVGVYFDIFLLALLGIFLLPLAFFARPRPPAPKVPPGQRPQPRRVSPPPTSRVETPPSRLGAPAPAPPPTAYVAPAPMSTQPSASSALFPAPILPSFSLAGPVAQPLAQAKQEQPGERDELLELGAIILILKLLSS